MNTASSGSISLFGSEPNSTSKRVLAALDEAVLRLKEFERARHEPIAIVGIGCRLPGNANDLESLWQLLLRKRDTVCRVPASRWDADEYYDPDFTKPGRLYVQDGAFLDGIEEFDAEFFGISPREALSLDPQQRLLLEVSWEALENAGIRPSTLAGTPAGVFVGITCNDYARRLTRGDLSRIDAHFATGNTLNAAAGRLSYVLGLQGPSLAIDTACSSSLVAVHLACQSLRAGECSVALTGGVNLVLSPEGSMAACRARMLAPDGRCKTFDAAADGYGRGEGCGVIVLKRLSDALADGDIPHALIRGSAVNQDGATSGLTVPNGPAQQKLIARALAAARLEPHQISYLEAHGTGTSLGDPVEYRAAVTSYGAGRARPLILGAVKANIGHLESAAGIAGLIKAILVLQHRTVPPQLHFNTPNPLIPWQELPAIVPVSALRLDESDRFAAVSSFGASGTNAHAIIETAATLGMETFSASREPRCLLVFSAKTSAALADLAAAYSKLAERAPKVELADLCFSAATTRESFPHRAAIIATDWADLAHKLNPFLNHAATPGVFHGCCDAGAVLPQAPPPAAKDPPSISISEWERLFNEEARLYVEGGPPPSHANTGNPRRVRLPSYPWQRQHFWPDEDLRDTAPQAAATKPRHEVDDWFYRPEWRVEPLRGARPSCGDIPSPTLLKDQLATRLAAIRRDPQVAAYWDFIGTLERASAGYIVEALETLGWNWSEGRSYNLAEFMRTSGVRDERRRLFRRMLQILEEDGLVRRADDSWQVTSARGVNEARNAQAAAILDHCAGAPELQLLRRCGSRLASVLRGQCEPLSLLFPSEGLTSAAHLYGESVGARIMNGLVCDTVRHLITGLSPNRELRVLEIGAGTGATTKQLLQLFPPERTRYVITDIAPLLVNEAREYFSDCGFLDFAVLDIERSPESQGLESHGYDLVIAANVIHATRDIAASLRHARHLLKPAGMLVLLEVTGPLRFIDLIFGITDGWWRFDDAPLRQDHAVISVRAWESVLTANGFQQCAALGSSDPADGLLSTQAVVIAQADVPSDIRVQAEPRRWLLLADRGGIADEVLQSFANGPDRAIVVRTVEDFQPVKNAQIILPSLATEEIRRALGSVRAESLAGIIHFWGCDVAIEESTSAAELAQACDLTTRTALDVLQGVLAGNGFARPPLWLVTRGVAPVPVPEIAGLAHSPLWGMLKSAALEYPAWKCSCIDLPLNLSPTVVRALVDELRHNEVEREVALREHRWVNRLVRSVVPEQATFSARADATYLITGGSRGLGPVVGHWLCQRGARQLVLISRTDSDREAQRAIAAARSAGCRVAVLQVDVADENQLRAVIATIRSTMPPLRGVIHGAGTLHDGLLAQQDWDRFRRVLRAKVEGAWNLHRLTADAPLDFFVMFSSIASLLGSPGQANHGAANAFLDTLAHYRRNRGLPALSINWGPWSELGAAARHQVSDRIRSKGMGTIPTELGLAAFDRCISSSAAQVGVVPIDWSVFREQFAPERRNTWLGAFEEIAAGAAPAPTLEEPLSNGPLLQRLRDADIPARWDVLREYVENRLREVLRIAPTRTLALHRPLIEMGLDSLMSTELKNRFVSELGVDVPMQTLIAGATISEVVRQIEERLTLADASLSPPGVRATNVEMEEITL